MEKINKQKGNGLIGLIVIIAIIWIVSSFLSENKPESSSYRENRYQSDSTYKEEPENPYGSGSGHSAGYEWAEENNVSSCGGNSDSFIEGCEEYLSQQEEEY